MNNVLQYSASPMQQKSCPLHQNFYMLIKVFPREEKFSYFHTPMHYFLRLFIFQNSVEGSLDAAAHEHGDLVRQLKETDAIAELLGKLYKVAYWLYSRIIISGV